MKKAHRKGTNRRKRRDREVRREKLATARKTLEAAAK
jgi:hypothetical protein